MSKENDKKWLSHLWGQQAVRATLFFNMRGHYLWEMGKSKSRRLTLDKLIEIMSNKVYGPDDIFDIPDSDSVEFLKVFGGYDILFENLNFFVSRLFNPYFIEICESAWPKDDEENEKCWIFFIGFWLFGLFALYSNLNPARLSQSVEKCLILNHNAHHIYGEVLMDLFGMELYGIRYNQTLAANMPKKEYSKLLDDKIKAYQKKHVASNPRFANLSLSQQAEKISKDLKKEDIEYAIRTIRRKLASRT
jgi:hypothetical protein